MPISENVADELSVLIRYNLDTTHQGIKVHSSADSRVVEATRRLYQKGLITQEDGGYLTDLGIEAAKHADALLCILSSN